MFSSTFLYEGLYLYLAKAKYFYICLFVKTFHFHWQEPVLQLLETIVVDGRARELALLAVRPVQNLEECFAVNYSDIGSEELKRNIECTSQGNDLSCIEHEFLSVCIFYLDSLFYQICGYNLFSVKLLSLCQAC